MVDKNNGFSLIELMVVLVIISLFMSIIGPEVFKMIDSSEARSEKSKLFNISEKAKIKAFASRKRIKILTSGNFLKIYSGKKDEKVFEFKHLSFPDGEIDVNENGFFEKSSLVFKLNGIEGSYD